MPVRGVLVFLKVLFRAATHVVLHFHSDRFLFMSMLPTTYIRYININVIFLKL